MFHLMLAPTAAILIQNKGASYDIKPSRPLPEHPLEGIARDSLRLRVQTLAPVR